MEGFYVTLPSNVKNGGTMSNYTTVLPYHLDLAGKWEVALTEMYMPHSWFNIDDRNNTIEYYEGHREEGMPPTTPAAMNVETNNSWNYNKSAEADDVSGGDRVFTHVNLSLNRGFISQTVLPNGYYNTITDIIDAIHQSLSPLAQKNIRISKNFDGTLTVRTENDAYLWLNENLTQMLGFEESYLKDTVKGAYVADIKNGLYSAIVYTDIILPQIIGDSQASVLRVVPLDGKAGKLLVYRFPTPDYIPVVRSSVSSIAINIRDDHGDPIVFQSGKVLCKLHFRPSRP